VTWKATVATMVFLFAAGGLAFVFPATAIGIFVDDAAVIQAGVELLRIIAPFWAFMGGLMVIQGGFRGAGDTKQAMALSLASRWLFRIPVAWLLAYHLTFEANGLWWAMAFSGVVTFVIGVFWFRLGGWKEGVVERDVPGGGAGTAGED
jgi:Na+-driven multidrug efflux pump